MDAILYVGHGRVFAGAMTGNAVLCGIALLSGRWNEVVHHFLPLVGFVLGVLTAQALDKKLGRHAVRVGLASECAGLLLASLLPEKTPELVFIPLVTVLAAYQIASFKKVDGYPYNSTFITGNARAALEGLYAMFNPDSRAAGRNKFTELGTILLAFLAGAALGALLEPHAGNRALWLPAALLLLVLIRVEQVSSRTPATNQQGTT